MILRNSRLIVLLLALWGVVALQAQTVMPDYTHRRFFDANNIRMPVYNNGNLASDPTSEVIRLEWPQGDSTFAVFYSGPWVAAKVNGEKRIALSHHFGNHFRPGPIVSGLPADPYDNRHRVYKITTEDLTNPGPDYLEWPADLGAPVDSAGNPKLLGDQTLWTVFNDADTITDSFYGFTNRLGLEVQRTVFGWNTEPIKDVVFLHYKIINKSETNWDSTFFSLACDFDLGFSADDQGGTDSLLHLVYGYNGFSSDPDYGIPPAIGYTLLKGAEEPASQRIYSSFIRINSPHYHLPLDIDQVWFLINGLTALGHPYVTYPAHDTMYTRYAFPGDPVTQDGWVDDSTIVTDRQFWITPWPVTMAAGDSLELVFAIVLALGADRLDSVTRLKEKVMAVEEFYQQHVDEILVTDQYAQSFALPERFILYPNFPNPFNPSTHIHWWQAQQGRVRITVYELTGREIDVIMDERVGVGKHQIIYAPRALSSGIYFVKLESGNEARTNKIVFLQ